MVFANLTEVDKEAFFALLDEYFSSRPELADALRVELPGRTNNFNPGPKSAGVAAAHRALAANPQATSAAIATGLKSVPKSNSQFASAASNPDVANAIGRVAAASLAFNGPNAPRGPGAGSDAVRPPPPPRRGTSSSSADASDAPPQAPPRAPPRAKAGPPSGLVTQRKISDIDTSSAKNMFWGMRNKEPPPPAAPIPSSLASKSKPLAPPPRRIPAARPPRTPSPEPEPEPEAEAELEYQGEWAEALYDYKSSDPNDLQLEAEQRVLVTERTSDDWWTGEVDGKSGLFPASYVKVL